MSTRFARYRSTAIIVLTCALGALRPGMAAAAENVTLSGCLVRADGDGHPYLLTNAPEQPALVPGATQAATPGSVGTTGEFRTVFYWLNGEDALRPHVGHRVEIEGDLKGDVKPGEIALDRKENWTEMTVKSDGRSLKARVPNLSLMPGDGTHRDRKGEVAVRRVEVEHVRMLAAACEP